MPEIAEVETVRRVLEKKILGKKIKNVDVLYKKMILNNIDEFENILIGNEFKTINRIGKWLLFELNDYILMSHLRMEGKYYIKSNNDKIEKHEHVIITFEDNIDLRYHDTRKFGVMKIVKKDKLYETKELKNMGLEIISDNINEDYLYNKLRNKRIPIKSCLLDQEIISGLGNIYVNEVLYASFINPLKEGNKITKKECKLIIDNGKKIINKAIECGGTTIKSYTSSLGVTGRYQDYLMVHKKENELCKRCNNKIENIKIGGRSTYYCKNCQK